TLAHADLRAAADPARVAARQALRAGRRLRRVAAGPLAHRPLTAVDLVVDRRRRVLAAAREQPDDERTHHFRTSSGGVSAGSSPKRSVATKPFGRHELASPPVMPSFALKHTVESATSPALAWRWRMHHDPACGNSSMRSSSRPGPRWFSGITSCRATG